MAPLWAKNVLFWADADHIHYENTNAALDKGPGKRSGNTGILTEHNNNAQ
jgi:hypothetical protein